MLKFLVISILSLASVSTFGAGNASTQAVPLCDASNEGQTVLLEDGTGGAVVYVCSQGSWIPASLR